MYLIGRPSLSTTAALHSFLKSEAVNLIRGVGGARICVRLADLDEEIRALNPGRLMGKWLEIGAILSFWIDSEHLRSRFLYKPDILIQLPILLQSLLLLLLHRFSLPFYDCMQHTLVIIAPQAPRAMAMQTRRLHKRLHLAQRTADLQWRTFKVPLA